MKTALAGMILIYSSISVLLQTYHRVQGYFASILLWEILWIDEFLYLFLTGEELEESGKTA